MTNLDAVRQWVDLVYPNDGTDEQLYVSASTPAGWRQTAYRRADVPQGVALAELEAPQGTYLSACSFTPGTDRKAEHAHRLFGIWSDLDIAGPGHKHDPAKAEGRALPPDEREAARIVVESGLPAPTAWVHSGGGLYAWWLLDAPTLAAGLGDLVATWQRILGESAKRLGWHYGTGVGDLARVLRVPGTINRKAGLARPCRLDHMAGPRYTLDDLLTAAVALKPTEPVASARPASPDPFSGPARVNAPARVGTSPLDAYEAATSWTELLETFGWVHVQTVGAEERWRHPDASHPESATVNHNGTDRLKCFSDNAGLPTDGTHGKAFVWACLTQRTKTPDMAEAASRLRAMGYGTGTSRSTVDRPALDVSNVAVAADWLREHAGKGELSGLFVRDGGVVFIAAEGEDGYAPPKRKRAPIVGEVDDHDGPAQIRTINAAGLAAYIDARYKVVKVKATKDDDEDQGDDGEPGGKVETPALFPKQAAERVIDLPDDSLRPGLRQLTSVTHTPTLRPDGGILAAPGYDDATGIYHLPDPGLVVPAIPDAPSTQDVKAAVALLDEMTAGFPWKSEHDRANYYGVLLTPLLRAAVPSDRKLVIFDAPTQGSGKTLLAQLVGILHGGVLRGGIQHTDEAELRKNITTILARTTAPVVVLDNLTGTLESPVLAGLLTNPTWTDRLLGANHDVNVPNDRLWTVTANNLSVGPDMVRRTLWVGIDAQMERPQDRTGFAIPDLPGWVRGNRGRLIAALLTLTRAWVLAGRPVPVARSSDSFTRWATSIDGILTHAGVPGRFDDPASRAQESAEVDAEWATCLRALHASFGDEAFTAAQALDQVPWPLGATVGMGQSAMFPAPRNGRPVIPWESLPGELAEKAGRSARGPSSVTVSFGRWLNYRKGRFAGGLACRLAFKDRTNVVWWRIVQVPT